MEENFSGCPHCNNQLGFTFGTCVECGYNYITKKFHFLKVWVSDLERAADPLDVSLLTSVHAERTKAK